MNGACIHVFHLGQMEDFSVMSPIRLERLFCALPRGAESKL